MEYTYEVIENYNGQVIKRTDSEGDEAWIPFDENNSDYQAYLAEIKKEEK
jgi:hypothetical protein